ncbi:MAG: thiol-disulfide oxidoreductase DCC family protein [Acidobacteriota bacterium]
MRPLVITYWSKRGVRSTLPRTETERTDQLNRLSISGRSRPPRKEIGRIVLFDGVCNFCNGAVRFILSHDKHRRFYFAPLQSKAASTVLKKHRLSADRLETFVLLEGESVYTRSSAVLRVLRQLSGWWPLLSGLRIVPSCLRDYFYDAFAVRRYGWFGKAEACFVPTPDIEERFLNCMK